MPSPPVKSGRRGRPRRRPGKLHADKGYDDRRFRRLSVRYERRADTHLAFNILGCALVCLNQIRRFC